MLKGILKIHSLNTAVSEQSMTCHSSVRKNFQVINLFS